MKQIRAALAAVCIFSVHPHALGAEANVCEREMVRAAAANEVPLGMLYAIGVTESGRDGSLQPYALNIEGRAVYEVSKAAAMRSFQEAQRGGAKLIDVGCMQINHHYHAESFSSLEDMLDPAQNVAYAAQFLSELKKREGSWTMAIARYHAGPNNGPAQKAYVCRVIGNMVEAGFGGWTNDARSYCGR
jgi:soluble lytic murein transglycosylase-like protein